MTNEKAFEKWAIDYGLDYEPSFTRYDVEASWNAAISYMQEQSEPVGELILDPVFLPALKAPLVNWKINLVDLEVGTKLYTSPQPREWVGLSDEVKQKLHKEHHLYIPTIELIESACKQLNTKG